MTKEPDFDLITKKHYECQLLHTKFPVWEGDILWDEDEMCYTRLLKWYCHACNVKGFVKQDQDGLED